MSPLARRVTPWAVGLVVVTQAFRPTRTNPPIDAKQEMTAALKVDGSVRSIVDRSCNDCHSSRTVWPWYSEVAPVSWLVSSDVNDGRRHMNFSEWGTYPDYKQKDLLSKICKIVTERDMPPLTYLLVHRAARLSDAEREAICSWTKAAAQGAALADETRPATPLKMTASAARQ